MHTTQHHTETPSVTARPTAKARMAAAIGVAMLAPTAMAQLTPERLYYGVDRPIPMVAAAPDGFEGEVSIALYDPATGNIVETAAAAAGRIDLAGLFPALWRSDDQKVLYAQLQLDGKGVGPAVVVQPLITPDYAPRANPSGIPVFGGQAQATFSGVRTYIDRHVVIETSMGEMVFRLRPDAAPNTAYNFRHLAESGFYTDIIVHRIVLKNRFVIQFGDPTGKGSGGPGYFIDLERSPLLHDYGVLSMARSGDPNSNSSQVFVCLSRDGTSFLDGRYTAFAEAVSGGGVIDNMAAVPVGAGDRPIDPPVIISARLIDAPPFDQRPSALEEPTPQPIDRSGG